MSVTRIIIPGRVTVEAYGALVVVLLTTIYSVWVGPYAEIPSDAIWHIGRIQDKLQLIIENRDLQIISGNAIFNKLNHYWYLLVGSLLYWSGESIRESLFWLTIGNCVLLLASFYWFVVAAMQSVSEKPHVRSFVGIFASIFFVLHFGTGVFSFLRYYTFGPVFLNFIVLFVVFLSMERYLKSEKWFDHWMMFAMIGTVVCTMTHMQEGMFAILMGLMILFLNSLDCYRLQKNSIARIGAKQELHQWSIARKNYLLTGLAIVAYLSVHGYLYTSVVRNNPLVYGVLTDVKVIIPFLKSLYILKPTHQFYQVITIWGVLVYACFFWRREQLRNSNLIMAAMLLPFFTVFNPIFTDLFLRISWPEVLWRIAYVIPLALVGGFFFWTFLRTAISKGKIMSRVSSALIAGLFLVLLFPIDNRFVHSDWSKIAMLGPVSAKNDIRVWEDLIDQLNRFEKSRVLTDKFTGYAINAYTHHEFPSHKFSGNGIMSLKESEYGQDVLDRYKGWLLVLNQKDGGISHTGKVGRHWGDDSMRVSQQYGEAFENLISRQPDGLELLWHGENQKIYRIGHTIASAED